jgi:tRNA pseudouridine38-40 synthase
MQYRLVLEYDGAEFSGWQIQPGERTVQATLEDALARLLGHPARVAAAGRTDAGVHATGQVACFHTGRVIDAPTVLRALNALTPRDVAVRSVDAVPDDFDPRRSARRREYVYRIWNRRIPSPFWRRYAWHVASPLAADRMDAAAALLVGEHDFTSFRAAGCDAAGPVRRVSHSGVARQHDMVVYTIEGTAFLRHMVRNIIGTLVEVGTGRRESDDMRTLLQLRDRAHAAATAPPHGLCLTRVDYDGTRPPR